MLHMAGEAAAIRAITAAAPHLHSAAGAIILVATPAGDPDLRAGRAGAAEAAVVAGAVAVVVVDGAGGVRPRDVEARHRENPVRTEE